MRGDRGADLTIEPDFLSRLDPPLSVIERLTGQSPATVLAFLSGAG